MNDEAKQGELTDVLTTTELIALAKARLPPPVWDFVVGGAETETTILRNRQALDAIAFRPRVLRNVSDANPAVTFLGAEQRLPVLLAPLASLTDVHPDGALPIARAAARFGCLMLVSSVTQPGIEDVARAAGEQFGFQLYPDGNERWVLDTAKRAVDLGCRVLCVTVDVPTFGRRERGMHRRQAIAGRPFGVLRSGEEHRGRADWTLIDKLKKKIDVPLMLKGIQTAEDAALALEHGVDVIYASNHGGRQLDHGRGAIDLLPEIMSATRGKAGLVIDGGFMRGTDILKAIAQGAAMRRRLGKLQASRPLAPPVRRRAAHARAPRDRAHGHDEAPRSQPLQRARRLVSSAVGAGRSGRVAQRVSAAGFDRERQCN